MLIVLHGFRLSLGLDWKKTAATALGAFIVCEVAASTLLAWADIHRETFMEPVLVGLSDRARILIVGSSHSASALDPDMLEAELQISVAQLTRAGAYAFEQDVGLDRYLARATPSLVLIEIGSEFYVKSDRKLFASYNIEHADLRRTWWGVLLVIGRQDLSLSKQLEAAWDRIGHLLAHITNAGIVRHARHERAWPEKGFRPFTERPAGLTDEDIARALAAEGGPGTHVASALMFRQWQKDKVLAMGVQEVRFYVPPIADPMRRGWADSLCIALGRDCMPMDHDFLRSVTPSMWADMSHLRQGGARLYTHWFAERLRAVQ